MQTLQSNVLLQGGKYKIIKTLGQGSFGITYLAEHTYLGKRVAVKEFFMKDLNSRGEDGSITGMSDSSLSYNYCQKFKKEAVNLSRLDHPNIVRVTDSFAENGTFYYVMDYIDGQNLNEYVKTHRISEAEAVNIIKHVADALIYMHETHHMLHLDLKPGNIMRRDSDGHVFLIDFGLSKHYSDSGQPETSTTIGLGTAGYAPIEQATQAKNGEFRATIDVYALGATLYKLLTGEIPPEASVLVSDETLIEENLREKGVCENLIKVVSAAMCPSVKKRPQSVKAFKDALDGSSKEENTVVVNAAEETVVPHVINTVDKLHETLGQSVREGKKQEGQKSDTKRVLAALSCVVVIFVFVFWLFSGSETSKVETYTDADSCCADTEAVETDEYETAIPRATTTESYYTYNSTKLGNGSIAVPGFLKYQGEYGDNGAWFRDSEGQVELYADYQSGYSNLNDVHTYVTNRIGNGSPTYDMVKDKLFVQSGYTDQGDIYYSKAWLDKSVYPYDMYFATILFPKSEKERMDDVILKIFKRFPNVKR